MSFSNNGGGRDHFANINSLNSVSGDFVEPPVSETDLSLFTNTEFFDWDVNGPVDDAFDPLTASSAKANFNFHDIPQIPNDSFDPQLQPQASWSAAPSEGAPSAPAPSQQPQPQRAQQPARKRADTASRSGPSPTESPAAEGDPLSVSAEEDKRRRNTAASARFRVKKKQREQAMEKTAKDMTDRVQHLETRVAELEKENRLLKNLLTEKSGSVSDKREDGSARGKRVKREVSDSP